MVQNISTKLEVRLIQRLKEQNSLTLHDKQHIKTTMTQAKQNDAQERATASKKAAKISELNKIWSLK